MIPVRPKPEPRSFDKRVRKKGEKLLRKLKEEGRPFRTSELRNYWRDALPDLHTLYDGICAYTCFYLLSSETVDHFLPKSKHPELAYEWSNFRLASQRVNQRKGENLGLIDPFLVERGWFTIDFPSCIVRKSNVVPSIYARQVENTIRILKLNEDDQLVQERCDIIMEYRNRHVRFEYLRKRYPFIAIEIERQNLVDQVGQLFKLRSS